MLFLRLKWWRLAAFWASLTALPCACLALGGWLFYLAGHQAHGSEWLPLACLMVVVALFPPMKREWTLRRNLKAMRQRHPSLTYELSWDADGLAALTPGLSEGRFTWAALNGLAMDERMVLVFATAKYYLAVPRASFTNEALADLKARLPVA